MNLVFVLVALIALGVLYQIIGLLADSRNYPPPGKLVDVNSSRLHLRVSGAGSPTVVLESGIAASSANWTAVQAALSPYTTVCSYDRAGFGWSAASPQPPTPHRLARELHQLLSNAGLKPPFVLVGHSFGGLIVRAFAEQYPDQTAGLVLVDALHHREWLEPGAQRRQMLRGGVFFSRIGAVLAAIGVVRFCLALLTRGSRKAPKAVLRSFGKGATTLVERIVGEVAKLPAEVWPAIRAHWSRPKPFLAMARYLALLPESSAEFANVATWPLAPVVVLSADREAQLARQRELAELCGAAEARVIAGCGHWIHLDQPLTVVETVKQIMAEACSRPR